MSAIRIESIPQTWDDTRDVAFFRIVAAQFSTEFVYGAGVLLASYDNLDAVAVVGVAADSDVNEVSVPSSSRFVPVASRHTR